MISRSDISTPPRLGLEILLLLSALTALLLLTHSGHDTSEASYHYSIAKQIVTHGSLSFPHDMDGIYYVAPNGRSYAAHEIGNTLLLLPVALADRFLDARFAPLLGPDRGDLIERFLLATTGAVLSAVGATFLYLTLRLVFAQSARAATSGVLMFSFCTFYWTYSRSMFDGVLCSVLLAGGMLFLFLFGRAPARSLFLVAALVFFGFGLVTRLSMVIPLAAAALYLLLVRQTSHFPFARAMMLAAIVLTPFVCWQLYYNHLRTGDAFLSPVQTPAYAVNNALDGNLLVGLAGLLFSPGKSIFVYCPIALLSVAVIRHFWRGQKPEAAFVCTVVVPWLLLHALLRSWYGAWGWGPRHFVTIAPALVLPFLALRPGLRPLLTRYCAAPLLTFGFVLNAASIVGSWHYRLLVASHESRIADSQIVWSLTQNQAADALSAALQNLQRTFVRGSYEIVPGPSAIAAEASNTINIWLFTAHRLGVPAVLLVTCGVILAAWSIIALSQLLMSHTFPTVAQSPDSRS